MFDIILEDACVGNLKHVSLSLPRDKLIVFTGVSGSGKSTLAKDVIYMECQRQYLEAINLQGIPKPNIKSMKHTSPAIIVTQHSYNKNPRSTVGTITNLYTDLRMIYEKLGERTCDMCKKTIRPYDCIEEIEKQGNEFQVYLFCPHCGNRMPSITRSHFSYNTREGACPKCHGMGTVFTPKVETILDETKSIQDGGVRYFEKRFGVYQSEIFFKALQFYQVAGLKSLPIKDLSEQQRAILLYGVESVEVRNLFLNHKIPKKVSEGKFEGVIPILLGRVSKKGGISDTLAPYFSDEQCCVCQGERLNLKSCEVKVMNTRLPQLVNQSLEEVLQWIHMLKEYCSNEVAEIIQDYVGDMETKIQRLIRIGLGYLSLKRQVMSLSGGEAQRLKLAALLDSEVCGILYILDEPSIGLHAKDSEGILMILKELRDRGNTVVVIEHDFNILKEADEIIEIGPFAGIHGGRIVASGSWDTMVHNKTTLTSMYANKSTLLNPVHFAKKHIHIKGAHLYNLKHINVDIPLNVLTCITGVSGSGKSTLIFRILAQSLQVPVGCISIRGLEEIDEVITIHQSQQIRSRRSSVATFTSLYDLIRVIFASSEDALKKGLEAKHFSFNVSGGRCEGCEGLGYVISNLLFFEDIEVVCPICHGQRFHDDVLSIKVSDKNILDVLHMSVEDACIHFKDHHPIMKILTLLSDVGLSYLTLGQSLSTLSGGEIQRLKLVKQLLMKKKNHTLYLIDEPTVGLHPYDIEHFMVLVKRLIEEGNSVVIVEHNLQLIAQADWIIDLGVEGGVHGGNLIVQGTPQEIMDCKNSYTGTYLKKEVQ